MPEHEVENEEEWENADHDCRAPREWGRVLGRGARMKKEGEGEAENDEEKENEKEETAHANLGSHPFFLLFPVYNVIGLISGTAMNEVYGAPQTPSGPRARGL